MESPKVIGVGNQRDQADFLRRNQRFVEHLPTLYATCDKVLRSAVTGEKLADRLIFFLNQLIMEEFNEILLLAGNGYGMAAKRLLRGMFERLVASLYIEQNKDAAERFVNYWEIQRRKYMNLNKDINKVDVFTPEERQALEETYQRIKGQFEEVLCKKCGVTRPAPSWTTLDMLSMARKVNLEALYLDCFFEPTMLLHNTPVALSSRLRQKGRDELSFNEGTQPDDADKAVRLAHWCLLFTLSHHDDHFKLGHKAEIDQRLENFKTVWPAVK